MNGRDHIKIISQISNNDINQAYVKLAEVHNAIGAQAKIAFDPKAGFLVNSPEEIGAGSFTINLGTMEGDHKLIETTKFGATMVQTIESAYINLGKMIK